MLRKWNQKILRIFSAPVRARIFFFFTDYAASKSNLFCHVWYFCMKKLKNCSIQPFKKCLSFVFCLFCFLLLSNNILHAMFYTYSCYWNIFEYKYAKQITFHAVKQSHAQMTSKDTCLLFTILFFCCRIIVAEIVPFYVWY